MNYEKLEKLISKMSPEQKKCDIAILHDGEVFSGSAANLLINKSELDQLDPDHPYIEILK